MRATRTPPRLFIAFCSLITFNKLSFAQVQTTDCDGFQIAPANSTMSNLLMTTWMDETAVTGPVWLTYISDSALTCSRDCLTNAPCLAYALPRNTRPLGSVLCRLYNSVNSTQYDPSTTTYFKGCLSLPTN